jgi:threonine synthase
MKFYSTTTASHQVSLSEAVLKGLAPDNGLYFPVHIPRMPDTFFSQCRDMSFVDIGTEVIAALLSDELPVSAIRDIVSYTLSFDTPLVEISEDQYALELFHGPTLAFKDVGARFCSQLMRYLYGSEGSRVRVLVATSGDTGSAVANGFYKVPGIEVVILYPKGKVSELQEKQFATLGENIIAIEVDGTFDDCQKMVKEAFLDEDLSAQMVLTSANSINVARWIPQCLYYFYSWSRIPRDTDDIVYTVPSGNFGNLAAGVLAWRMGLPVTQFIAATNVNNVVPEYLSGEAFTPRPSLQTISNSMDVGNPSNFPRLLALYDNDDTALRAHIKGYYYSDDETAETMREVFDKTSYILDPHAAVACRALSEYQKVRKVKGIFLETAHPAKFKSTVDAILGVDIPLPERLRNFLPLELRKSNLPNSFTRFRDFLFQLDASRAG